ncbi:phosphotransferase family protein [Phenylobacterium sp.]|uniref:phosphotransferase family protein n=1 Tax=Phenylobacterium sp. TaxID=1871053 RepID=UPI002F3EA256
MNSARLEQFLRETLGVDDPLEIEGRALSGSSNITVFIRLGDVALVLRRPPPGELLPTAHDMMREAAFLKALAGTAVPVPQLIAKCEDRSVLGAPFYVMSRVDGIVVQQEPPENLRDPAALEAACGNVVDCLAALHSIEWSGLGLPGRPHGYLERQVARWQAQLALTPSASRLPRLEVVTAWVSAHVPEQRATTIVHGDYGLHNLILDRSEPRVRAVLDWEMATLGDPIADLIWFLQGWGVATEPGVGNPANYLTTWPGAPSRSAMMDRYQAQTGRAVENELFYRVFSTWKGIIVTEGLYDAFLKGEAANPAVARFETQVPAQVERARALLE